MCVFNRPQWCPHLNAAILPKALNKIKKVLESCSASTPAARIGYGVHDDGGLGPRLEPHLVLHLDQLVPAQRATK